MVSNDHINRILDADDNDLTPEIYAQTLQDLKNAIENVSIKKEENKEKLEHETEVKNNLDQQKKLLEERIEEVVLINDQDRELILKQTKEMDRLRNHYKKTIDIVKSRKPGSKIKLDGILFLN